LARQWIGDQEPGDIKEINVTAPAPTKEGINISDQTEVKVDKIPIPPSFGAATDIVKRFEQAALGLRGDEDVADSVAQHKHLDKSSLQDEKWLGTEEEELNALSLIFLCRVSELMLITFPICSFVSEQLYIHSKLMIVDDRRVIVGELLMDTWHRLTLSRRWDPPTSMTAARRWAVTP
jgi:phospholipase D1/2